ncbi:MAG: hypothetical protein JKX72_11630, partial [Robiginitomaculum sp.]|nr:hypothetical protein [Robiginitomaculum sp.]
ILFFSFMSLTNTHFLSFDVLPKDNSTQEVSVNNNANNANSTPAESKIENEESENTDMNFSVVKSSGETNILSIGGRQVKIKFFTKNKDLHKITDEEIQILTNQINNELDVQINNENIDSNKVINSILSNPKQFNSTFNTWLPRIMFFMVPFAMIFGWLFIRGPKALLIDHLIHAIYLQSVLFITTLLTLILSQFTSGDRLVKILFLILLVYFTLSLKHMFGRGWIKTIWTSLVGGFLYSTILFIAMAGITLVAFTNIAS